MTKISIEKIQKIANFWPLNKTKLASQIKEYYREKDYFTCQIPQGSRLNLMFSRIYLLLPSEKCRKFLLHFKKLF